MERATRQLGTTKFGRNKVSATRRRSGRRRRLGFQSLESRQLLAAHISELLVSPLFGNNNTTQLVELRGEPNAVLGSGTYLAIVGEAKPDEGLVHGVFDLSGQAFGANGYLVLLQEGSPHVPEPDANVLQSTAEGFGGLPGNIYNDSHTLSDRIDFIISANGYFLIQTDVAPTLGMDIDVENDGVIDPLVANAWTVLDSISLHPFVGRGELAYGDIVFAARGSSEPAIAVGDGVSLVVTDGFGYAGRVGQSTGSTPLDWVYGTVQDEAGVDETPQWALVDNLFGTPSQYAFSGRDLDHVGGPNFVGGASGSVINTTTGQPIADARVFADSNSNSIQDVLSFTVDPDDVIDPAFPDETYPLVNAYPGVTVTNFALESFAAHTVTAEQQYDFPNRLRNRVFAKGGIDWFTSSSRLRFDFYHPARSASIAAIGDDNSLSTVYGRLDAYNAAGELLDTDVSSLLLNSRVETLTVSSETDDISYLMAYTDEVISDGEGGPFGRFDRLTYSQIEPFATTNEQGAYHLTNLFPGSYQLRVANADLIGEGKEIEIAKFDYFQHDFGLSVNARPVLESQQFAVAEDLVGGGVVGMATGSDPNGHELTYAFGIEGVAGLTIDPSTAQIKTDSDYSFDFEIASLIEFEVVATDTLGLSTTSDFSIRVTDVNEPPVVDSPTFAVEENAAVGVTVGAVSASDPDGDSSLSFQIVGGNGQEHFVIDPETGQVKVSESAKLDFETIDQFTLLVAISDGGLSAEAQVTIRITDSNDAPVFGAPIDEANGTTGSEFSMQLPGDLVADPDGGAPGAIQASLESGDLPAWLKFDPETMTFEGIPTTILIGPIQVRLTVVDADDSSLSSTTDFTLNVTRSSTPLHNDVNAFDVDGDREVNAIDALRIINFLTKQTPGVPLDLNIQSSAFFDVSGDNLVSAFDALQVINQIARTSRSGSGSGGGEQAIFGVSDDDDHHTLALASYLGEPPLF